MAKKRLATVIPLQTETPRVAPEPEIAWLVAFSAKTGIEVECADGRRVSAESTLDLGRAELLQLVAEKRRVLLLATKSQGYVIAGLMRETGETKTSDPEEVNVRIDGDRLVLHGHKEIVLRCGASSIVLKASGEVVIRGNSVASRSRGANVLSGATIRLN